MSLVENCGSVLLSENLIKEYDDKQIVKGVSVQLNQGEIVGLLGPNGAGKTTVFYMIAGLGKPTAGTIFLNNRNITEEPLWTRAKLGIGYLAQEQSIFLDLTVEENILLPLELKEISKVKQTERLNELIEEFKLDRIRKSYGKNLSGGERRRVELARLLAIEPKFILLDEPFAGVDPIAVGGIQKLISLLKKKNIGVLITDHNVDETLGIVDRAYILYNGEVVCQGTPKEIVKNERVRELYLGQQFEMKI